MSFFSRDKKQPAHDTLLMDDAEIEQHLVNYNSVVDWLVGLSDQDYKTVHEVAAIYRAANVKAAKALGVENEPTTAIVPAEPEDLPAPHANDELDFLEDDLESSFLDDDEPSKPQKVEVKTGKKK